MPFLEIRNVYKSYKVGKKDFPVLKDVNLAFEKGEFVSILGESGGGKSTLMNIIGGLDKSFDGSILVGGKPLNYKNAKQLDAYRRATVGYIFQSFNLINYQTNLENVETSLNMTDLSKRQRRQKAMRLLERVGLEEHANKYPSQLSGGQKQRIAIARAIASDPDIIIADELTGALDAINTQEILQLLGEIAREGKIVIAVTHSQEVANYGTRIVHMESGTITEMASAQSAYQVPNDSEQSNQRKTSAIKSKPFAGLTIMRMALEHLKYKKIQSFWIIFGSLIGLTSVILFLGLGNGVQGYIDREVHVLLNPDYPTVTQKVHVNENLTDEQKMTEVRKLWDTNYKIFTFTPETVEQLRKVNHVDQVHAGYQFDEVNFAYNDKKTTTTLRSWDSSIPNNAIKIGNVPQNDDEVVITQEYAKKIDKNWESVLGRMVALEFVVLDNNNKAVKINFLAKVSGISGGGRQGNVFGMAPDAMRRTLEYFGAVAAPNMVKVHVDDTKNVGAVADDIKKFKDENGKQAFNVETIGNMLNMINNTVKLASTVLAAIAGISLIVSAIMIIVTTYMSVAERTQEIGILRALGGRARDIRRLFTNEALLIGIISGAAAIGCAKGIELLANSFVQKIVHYNMIQILPGHIIQVMLISILIAWLASFVPSRKAAKLNTIDALSSN
ncbi:ATP-binding cassette domain-containing protein [Convivina intestini]|uniref:ABC-type lipoprotein export system ATPase subunit n=1 Tax=Convivina intestini TaxID=1505726 RepID=A0A2U1D560_9LACO|nr:ABC transporter ATP-binding protein/permease [Convivina intestini]PVY82824.1 ABC-type lipoprotein export system ATPase subunit [Convivina intestini]CAH1856807.1 Macrolide export ATP-binding/permease protein MacB [Convivina intestini]SDC16140.1 ABC-type lipoprotein export system, ATPase component [Leuconostocaceae bacterium R-53105]